MSTTSWCSSRCVSSSVGERGVPGVADVPQVVGRRLDRRDLLDLRRAAPGEDIGLAVDARVAEPALGAADQPAGHLRPLDPGELADDPVGALVPGQPRRAGGQLVLAGQVEERRQHRPRRRLGRGDELGDRESRGCRPTAARGPACRRTRPRSWSCPGRSRRDNVTATLPRLSDKTSGHPTTKLTSLPGTTTTLRIGLPFEQRGDLARPPRRRLDRGAVGVRRHDDPAAELAVDLHGDLDLRRPSGAPGRSSGQGS